MTFSITIPTPENLIAIPDALTEIVETLRPGTKERAVKEIKSIQGTRSPLPESYFAFCRHISGAERLLLRALANRVLDAYCDDEIVPTGWWRKEEARVNTLTDSTYRGRR